MIAFGVPAFSQGTPTPNFTQGTPTPNAHFPAGIKIPKHIVVVPTLPRPPEQSVEVPIPQFTPTEEQMKFAGAYIKAVNDNDAEGLRKLIAPKSLACFNSRNEYYLDQWIERQLKDQIASPYKVTVEEVGADDQPTTTLFTLPVPPTHQLDIETTLNGRRVTIGRPIAYQDGGWYEIAPCPTDAGMALAAKQQQHIIDQQNKAAKLYATLSPAFKKSLVQLLLQNKGGDACQRAATELHVDVNTGCGVVRILADDPANNPEKSPATAASDGKTSGAR